MNRLGTIAVIGAATTGYLCYQGLVVTVPYALLGLGVVTAVVGMATFVFMVAATVMPFAVIGFLDGVGLGTVLTVCAAAVGLPALLEVGGSTPAILVGALVRGAAFGMLSLVTAVAVVRAAPPSHTGRWLGIHGFATSAAAIIGQPLGLELAARSGVRTAVVVLAVVPFLGVVPFLASARLRTFVSIAEHFGAGENGGEPTESATLAPHTRLPDARRQHRRRMMRPLLSIAAVTAALGVVVTFGGAAVEAADAVSPSLFFLLLGLAIPVGRLLAGQIADRRTSSVTASAPTLVAVSASLAAMTLGDLTALAVLLPVVLGVGTGLCISGGQVALVREQLFASVHRATAWFGAAWNIPMGLGALVAGAAGVVWSPREVIAASAVVPLAAALFIGLGQRPLRETTSPVHLPI